MLKSYAELELSEQQRIDCRVFVGEHDRLLGEATYTRDDPRLLFTTGLDLKERIEFLREVYADDYQTTQRFHWDKPWLEEIKFKRTLELQKNIVQSGRVGSTLEEMIELLDLPYLQPVSLNAGRR